MATLAETITATAQRHNPTESANEVNARVIAGSLWDDPADSLVHALLVADTFKRYDEQTQQPAVVKSGMTPQTAPEIEIDEAFLAAAINLVDSINGQRPELHQQTGRAIDIFERLKPLLWPILEKLINDLISRWLATTPTQQPEFL